MDETRKRKIKGYIRESLLLVHETRVKVMGNPYGTLGNEPDHKALNCDAEIIFNHLERMGVVK